MFFSAVAKLNLNSAGEFRFNFATTGKDKLQAVMHFVMLVDGSCLVLFWHLYWYSQVGNWPIETSLQAILTRKN